MGIPAGALGFVIGIDSLLGRFRTASNILGDVAATVAVSASEGELDDAVYSA